MIQGRGFHKEQEEQTVSRKILIVTTVSGFLWQFERGNVALLKNMGIEIHYASNFENPVYAFDRHYFRKNGIHTHHLSISKSPFHIRKNFKALKKLIHLIRKENIDVIHCHTPMGAVLGRLAGRLAGNQVKVIYTAHGFHFYKGAPLRNWLLYYPAERFLARYTDCLVTVNKEDQKMAEKFKLKHNGNTARIPGVGLDLNKFRPMPWLREQVREQLGVKKGQVCLMTSASLNRDKNHQLAIRALSRISHMDFQYFICGEGLEREKLEELIHLLGLQDRVHFLGYCRDMEYLLQGADLFLFPSVREGFGMAPLEALACGKPVIAADNRGIREYLQHEKNGMVCSGSSSAEFANAITELLSDKNRRNQMAKQGTNDVKKFASVFSDAVMQQVYGTIFASAGKGAVHENLSTYQRDHECLQSSELRNSM